MKQIARASDYYKDSLYRKVNGYHKFVSDTSKFEYEFKIREFSSQLVQVEVYLKNETAKTNYLKNHKTITRLNRTEIVPHNRFQFVYENGKWKIQVA